MENFAQKCMRQLKDSLYRHVQFRVHKPKRSHTVGTRVHQDQTSIALAHAKTFEEALEFYRLGQSVGPDMTTKFDKYVRERNVFAVHSLRGYFRCVQGEANTLRKMGRAKESVVVFEKLMQLDPNR
jgi:hypothetical protein